MTYVGYSQKTRGANQLGRRGGSHQGSWRRLIGGRRGVAMQLPGLVFGQSEIPGVPHFDDQEPSLRLA